MTSSNVARQVTGFSRGAGARGRAGAATVGAGFEPDTGTFNWTPGTDQGPGRYPITVVVSAGGNPAPTDRRTFTVVVEDTPTAGPPIGPPVGPPPDVRLTAESVPPGADPYIIVRNATDGSVRFTLTMFGGEFRGGAGVAVGDVTGDGVDDVIVGAATGGGPRIQVFDGATGGVAADFYAFDPEFRGGVGVAVGPGGTVVAAAGAGGGPRVRVLRPGDGSVVADFFAFDPDFRGGVSVVTGDVTGDGVTDLIVGAGPGGGPEVRVFDGATGAALVSFFVGPPEDRNGVRLAVTDADGDGRAEVVAGGEEPGNFQDLDPFAGAVLTDGVFVG